jgi:serine/threonine-protein kinase
MRQCPICSARYDDAVDACPRDGASLGAPDPLLGAVIDGKYEVTRLLGFGGMGAVYRATQLALKRDVALKVVRNDCLVEKETVERFEREATIVARLRHPNVVAVYDFGWSPRAGAYLVMEYLTGRSLREELRRCGRVAPAETVEIMGQVCAGLQAAHAAGVIHRDLKPDNVFLEPGPDGRPVAKVLDFGIAKLDEAGAETPLTAAGMLLGTAFYMSPEQIESRPLDARSDVYSLGCVLYEMLTGQPPFPSGSISAVLYAHVSREPEPPSRIAPDLPRSVDAVVLVALAKRPRDRFQSAVALHAALASAAAEADPDGPRPGARAARPGAPTMVWGGLAPTEFVDPTTGESGAGPQEDRLGSLAVLPFENAGGDPDSEFLSEGVTDQLINDIAALPKVRVTARSIVYRYKGLEVDPLQVGRELGVEAVLVGRIRLLGERLVVAVELVDVEKGWRIWGERYTRPLADLLTVQDEIVADVTERLRAHVTGSRRALAQRHSEDNEAYQDYLKGQYFWNMRPQALRESLAHFGRAAERDPDYALAHAGVAAAYAVMGSWEAGALPPTDAMPRAATAARRALDIDPRLAEAHAALAYVHLHFDRDYPSARRECEAAIASNPRYAMAHHWNSHCLLVAGDVRGSLEASKRCLALDPLDLVLNVHMAWHCVFAHEYDEAIEQAERVRELEPNYFWSFFFGGMALEQQGRLSEAIDAFRRAAAFNSDVTYPVAALGHAYAAAGETAEAKRLLDDLRAAARSAYVPSYDVATLLAGLGETDDAFAWLEKAYAERLGWIVYVGADPRWQSLSADPRFQHLARRLGLPAVR